MEKCRAYVCIDLKSFYASVECVERGLDPIATNLVVADPGRTEKTICLAVSPALKAYDIPGRARLFEVVRKVKAVNAQRRREAPNHTLEGESADAGELKASPALALSYVAAVPRMALYMEYSARIYHIYLRFVAPEDIHVYSVDEVFIDATHYLETYGLTAAQLARRMVREVYAETGITATAGVGTNLYLAKIAMDIMAKRAEPDENGVRVAELDEMSYRRQLWSHRPLTDFWRIGRGIAKKLEQNGLFTLGDVARCSVGRQTDYYNEDFLYKLFGVNAELLIDHAWGWEPCTMAQIKAYRPESSSYSAGQVLQCPYDYEKTKLIVREMAERLTLDLVEKELVTDQVALDIGYDIENLTNEEIRKHYAGEVVTDAYGRSVPKHAHGVANLKRPTSSTRLILEAVMALYARVVNEALLTRRIVLTANRLARADGAAKQARAEQLDLFTDYAARQERQAAEEAALAREKKIQQAMIGIQKKYGKNAILKGTNLEEGATAMQRNRQIGGHKA